jgi:hypothetical protein
MKLQTVAALQSPLSIAEETKKEMFKIRICGGTNGVRTGMECCFQAWHWTNTLQDGYAGGQQGF